MRGSFPVDIGTPSRLICAILEDEFPAVVAAHSRAICAWPSRGGQDSNLVMLANDVLPAAWGS